MNVLITSDNVISPLGFTTEENFASLERMQSGVVCGVHEHLGKEPVCAALIDRTREDELSKTTIREHDKYTRLEKLAILSATDALSRAGIDATSERTIFIFSSTKGNIDLLGNSAGFPKERLLLSETARQIANYFGNQVQPLVVSNACISGVLAIILGKRLLEEGKYANAVVIGADILTHFVVSGFQSFKAVSPQICKPYDASRDGISLGEAAGTVILTASERLPDNGQEIMILGGSSSNDANHISGPSRDGSGLNLAIMRALEESQLQAKNIDHISGHGTATVFNDEMESIAITNAGLSEVPMNSLKSFFGHTLGAAGLIESVIAVQSLRRDKMIGTFNHSEGGVSGKVNILKVVTDKKLGTCMKTAAGFGGCNAAIVYKKI
jgi:3-oxoacyl-[acyl-carrier-protein] synthase-1